jgi:NADP-dependent 3-hydroxy acid dehydrogenase YdfG
MITGATSGIGKATAKLFAKKGFNIIITGRRADRLARIKESFETKYGVRVECLAFDIRDYEAASEAFYSLPETLQNIDILINNAGGAKGLDTIYEGSLTHWETMIDTNIKGILYLTKLVSPKMVERGKGHIINICSTAGHEVYPKGAVYCATKYAVNALTKGMRLDLYQHGIRVSQISPGHVEDTEFALNRFDGHEDKAKIYEDFNPLKAKDIADMIFYVASRAQHINIQDILVMSSQQAGSQNIDRSGRKY